MANKVNRTSCFTCQNRDKSEWCVLTDQDLLQVDRAKVSNLHERGQILFHQGDPCLGVHCIEQGTVALRRTDSQGHSVITELCHAGSTLGYGAYFSNRPHSVTAEVLEKAMVCFIQTEVLRRLLDGNPALGYRFLGTMARRLDEAAGRALEGAALPLRARLAHLLLVLKDRYGKMGADGVLEIEIPMARQDIAALLGARPESVSRALHQLEEAGVAAFNGRSVRVPDLDPLLDEIEPAG